MKFFPWQPLSKVTAAAPYPVPSGTVETITRGITQNDWEMFRDETMAERRSRLAVPAILDCGKLEEINP
jgi:hypothetical protein